MINLLASQQQEKQKTQQIMELASYKSGEQEKLQQGRNDFSATMKGFDVSSQPPVAGMGQTPQASMTTPSTGATLAQPQSISQSPLASQGTLAAGSGGISTPPHQPPAPPSSSQSRYTLNPDKRAALTGKDPKEIASIGDAIISGEQPPDLTRLYGKAASVRAYLAKQGFNLTKASADWTSTQQFAKSLNNSQQVRMNQALESAAKGVSVLRQLSSEFQRTGWTPANKAELTLALTGTDPSKRDIATKYVSQINLMKDEMAQAFMGGGVPTDRAFILADQILEPAYGFKQMDASLNQLETNFNIRRSAIRDASPVLVGQDKSSLMGNLGLQTPSAGSGQTQQPAQPAQHTPQQIQTYNQARSQGKSPQQAAAEAGF